MPARYTENSMEAFDVSQDELKIVVGGQLKDYSISATDPRN